MKREEVEVDYEKKSIAELEAIRSEARKEELAARARFVEAGKALDAKRRRAKLEQKKTRLAEQIAEVDEELAKIG